MIKENTNYHWDPEAKFEINGLELQLLINGLRMVLDTPEARNILTLNEMSKMSVKLLEDGLKSGKVHEGTPPATAELKQDDNPLKPV